MHTHRLWRLAILLVFLPGVIRGAESWARLKIGMTADEAVAALGEPLGRTSGQGLELWTYDNRAEVLFYGPLIAWTSPSSGRSPGRSVDIWQRPPGAPEGPMFLLPRPPRRPDPRKEVPISRDTGTEGGKEGSTWLPYYRPRR